MKNYLLVLLISLSGCGLLEQATEDPGPNIAEGLKEALRVGTDTAVSKLAVADGYLKDQAVKILLPEEMEQQIQSFKAIEIDVFGVGTLTGEQLYESGAPVLGINSMAQIEENLVIGINRAAESAANEAAPIFVDAITNITIADAREILFGEDDAATVYLKENTFEALFDLYEPKIDAAISSVKVGEKSVEEHYTSLVTTYNNTLETEIPTGLFESTTLGELAQIESLTATDLSEFATGKGLDGVFLKIREEEANIRKDPIARVTELLKDVFGLLD